MRTPSPSRPTRPRSASSSSSSVRRNTASPGATSTVVEPGEPGQRGLDLLRRPALDLGPLAPTVLGCQVVAHEAFGPAGEVAPAGVGVDGEVADHARDELLERAGRRQLGLEVLRAWLALGDRELGRELELLRAGVAVEALLPLVGAADDLGVAADPLPARRGRGPAAVEDRRRREQTHDVVALVVAVGQREQARGARGRARCRRAGGRRRRCGRSPRRRVARAPAARRAPARRRARPCARAGRPRATRRPPGARPRALRRRDRTPTRHAWRPGARSPRRGTGRPRRSSARRAPMHRRARRPVSPATTVTGSRWSSAVSSRAAGADSSWGRCTTTVPRSASNGIPAPIASTAASMRSRSSYHPGASAARAWRVMRTTSAARASRCARAHRARRRRRPRARGTRRPARLRWRGGRRRGRTSPGRRRGPRGPRPPAPGWTPGGGARRPSRGAPISSASRYAVRNVTPAMPSPASVNASEGAAGEQPACRDAHVVGRDHDGDRRERVPTLGGDDRVEQRPRRRLAVGHGHERRRHHPGSYGGGATPIAGPDAPGTGRVGQVRARAAVTIRSTQVSNSSAVESSTRW